MFLSRLHLDQVLLVAIKKLFTNTFWLDIRLILLGELAEFI